MQSMTLRAHLESVLGERIMTTYTEVSKRVCASVPSGIDALDAKIGGLPRGAVTEIFGLPSSGKTSMLLSILAATTARDEVCALVDGNDAFSPESGAKSGINLKRLLWVRCHNVDQSIKVTDLLLQSGGFGVVALDISDLQTESLQAVPLSTWFRFQRAIEKTPTILAILSKDGIAKTCSSLALHLEGPLRRFAPLCPTGDATDRCRRRLYADAATDRSRFPGIKPAPTEATAHSVGQSQKEGSFGVNKNTLTFEKEVPFARFLANDGIVPVTAQIVRNRQAYTLQSHVCFSLYSEFSRPGARP